MGNSPGPALIPHFPIIILGGGIVGAGIFRDLALHKIPTLLLEKGDFCSQTSAGSSKMLHGGIRYLENFDFALVHEALREKNLWLKLAPHLAYEAAFHFPIFKESKYPLTALRMGLFLYDLLSNFKNTPHRILNKKQLLNLYPQMKDHHLSGAGVYFDGVVDDRGLGEACIQDGLTSSSAQAWDHHEVVAATALEQGWKLTVLAKKTQQIKTVSCQQFIIAGGPFTDQVMKDLKIPWTPCLAPSKGIHLWLKKSSITAPHPMVLQTRDGRVIFLIPHEDRILAGTTETPVHGEFFNIQASPNEIDYLLQNLRDYFPRANLQESSIEGTFAAVRPLVRENPNDHMGLGKISREHKIFHPSRNLTVVVGGKYTTFRVMAQDVLRPLMRLWQYPYNPNLSLSPLRK